MCVYTVCARAGTFSDGNFDACAGRSAQQRADFPVQYGKMCRAVCMDDSSGSMWQRTSISQLLSWKGELNACREAASLSGQRHTGERDYSRPWGLVAEYQNTQHGRFRMKWLKVCGMSVCMKLWEEMSMWYICHQHLLLTTSVMMDTLNAPERTEENSNCVRLLSKRVG